MAEPPILFSSPLSQAELSFSAMRATEGLSLLGEMDLTLLSTKADIAPSKVLGKAVTVTVQEREGGKRHFHGYVTRFGMGVHQGRNFGYRATVSPWLWFLTRTIDCRMFQNESVPDIVTKVFQDHGVASFDFKLFRTYRKWTYCVQYRESDFNFVARLLEHEGIYWYFEHHEKSHKLILIDSQSAHDAVPGCEKLPFVEGGADTTPDADCVWDWSYAQEVRSGKFALTSFDFERPSVDLSVTAALPREHDQSDLEVFDWQGDYVQAAHGTQIVEDLRDEVQTPFETFRGASNATGLTVGRLLTIARHPRQDFNDQYVLTSVTHQAWLGGQDAAAGPGGFSSEFTAIRAAQQYRPARRTPKPYVQGPQTAVVVGPSGEEIFTDKYGRVKLHFHWDRRSKKDEKSSCWVRVSHPWAGKNFGIVDIPRIGQEVVVDFLEGDPDQPLITGRVYNAEQMPPWELPANATQSGILTRSSKGGAYGNANAIRFEDKKGSEQLWIHAEKNQDIEVENDETHWVGHDRSKTVDHDETVHVKHDRTETVDNNETITIGVDRTENVGNNETIGIGVNRTETVGSNETITIGANRTENVGANETISIGANRTVSVGASETATVALQRTHAVGVNETITIGAAQEIAIGAAQIVAIGAMQSTTVGASQSTSVGGSRSIDVGANQSVKIGASLSEDVAGNHTESIGQTLKVEVGKDGAFDVGKNLTLVAGEQVTIKTGDASLIMKKDGSILLKGKDIKIQGSGKVIAKADGEMVLKGSSKVTIN